MGVGAKLKTGKPECLLMKKPVVSAIHTNAHSQMAREVIGKRWRIMAIKRMNQWLNQALSIAQAGF